jgi:hypothetical protein
MTYDYYPPGGLNLSKNYCVSYVIIVLSISQPPYSKSLSQNMTVSAHRGAGMKIHTSRSMASTINTSRSESLFWPRHCKISSTLTSTDGTLTVDDSTLTSTDSTLTVDSSTRMSVGSTLMAGNGTLAIDGSTDSTVSSPA